MSTTLNLSKQKIIDISKGLGIANADIIFNGQTKFTQMLDLVFKFVQMLVEYPEHAYKLPKFALRPEPIPDTFAQGIDFLNKSLLLKHLTNELNLNSFGIKNYHDEKFLTKFFSNIINLGRFNESYIKAEQNAARERMAIVTDELNQIEIKWKQTLEEEQRKQQLLTEMDAEDIDNKYESLITAIDKQQKKNEALQQKIDRQNIELQSKKNQIQENNDEIERLTNAIKSLDDILNVKPDEERQRLEKEQSNLELALRTSKSLEDEKAKVQQELDSFNEFYNLLFTNMPDFQKYGENASKQKQVDMLQDQIARRREDMNNLQQAIQEMQKKKDAIYEIDNKTAAEAKNISEQIQNAKKKLRMAKEKHKKELANYRYQIDDVRSQLDAFNRELWKMMNEIDQQDKESVEV